MNDLKFLDWDSTFFKRKIGSITITNPDDAGLKSLIEEGREGHFEVLYVFSSGEARISEEFSKKYSLHRVDSKVTYTQQLSPMTSSFSNPHIKKFKIGDSLSELYDLARESGEFSRYKIDKRFGESEFVRFYKTWVDNSLSGEMADAIFIYKIENTIKGFITVKKNGVTAAISLLATHKNSRRQGIGKALIDYVKNYLRLSFITTLDVVTQRDNIVACSFYERNGFSIKEELTVYHCWL